MYSILVVAGALGLAIFVHELGHLIVARWCGISVASFSIGFGKRLFTKKIGLIEYSLRMLPLGGFVQLCGMFEDTSAERKGFLKAGRSIQEVDELLKPSGLYVNAPWWKQMATISAGCAVNIVLAVAILSGYLVWRGSAQPSSPLVIHSVESAVTRGSGIQAGDVFVSCNGMTVERLQDLRIALTFNKECSDVVVEREGAKLAFKVPPREQEWEGLLGVRLQGSTRNFTLLSAIPEAIDQSVGLVKTTLRLLFSKRVLSMLKSPIGMTHDVHKSGMDQLEPIEVFERFITISCGLGIALAVGNLLPIPVLDGGHMVFAALKMVRRGREVPVGFKSAVLNVFLVALVGLQAFIIIRDVIALWL